MHSELEASIIVPAYNRRASLLTTLRSLNNQKGCDASYEVIIVDDGSTDGTSEMVEGLVGHVKYPLRLLKTNRLGPGLARNCGADVAKGKVILFTDSDCIPDPSWVVNMTRAVKTVARAVGGRIEPHEDSSCCVRIVNYIMSSWLGGFGRKWRLWGFVPGHRLRTGNAAVASDQFADIGGFSSVCGFYGEDTELSERLADRYGDPEYCTSAIVYHREDRNIVDYCSEAFARGLCTASLLRERRLRMRGIYLLPLVLLVALTGTGILLLTHVLPFAPFTALTLAYFTTLCGYGINFAVRTRVIGFAVLVPTIATALHCCYGVGLTLGLFGAGPPIKGKSRPEGLWFDI